MSMVFCNPDFSGGGFSLLFKSWVIASPASYVGALAATVALGGCRQLLSALRAQVVAANDAGAGGGASSEEALLPSAGAGVGQWPASAYLRRHPLALAALDTALYAGALLLGYINMLIAMAFDAGLLCAIVVGEAAAYFAVLMLCRRGSRGGNSRSGSRGGGDAPCCE